MLRVVQEVTGAIIAYWLWELLKWIGSSPWIPCLISAQCWPSPYPWPTIGL
jgi:hypothetical protein